MQETRMDLLDNLNQFELIALPCSQYQKKNGEIVVGKDGTLFEISQLVPNLAQNAGSMVERFGMCPSIIGPIPNTTKPTKVATFPTTPVSLITKDADHYVIARLRGKLKKSQTLIPGWMLAPRTDILEFACMKLMEIVRWYKLERVAIPADGFNLMKDDTEHIKRVMGVLKKYLSNQVYLIFNQKETHTVNINTSTVVEEISDED